MTYVFPGQLVVARRGARLSTVLGSCVAVCLFDPLARVGGMNHFLLPFPVGDAEPSPRFAGPATSRLIGELLTLGARQQRLVAKLFGGCSTAEAGACFRVGPNNVEAARAALAAAHIPVLDEDVGGALGRHLTFDTGDGSVRVQRIGRATPS